MRFALRKGFTLFPPKMVFYIFNKPARCRGCPGDADGFLPLQVDTVDVVYFCDKITGWISFPANLKQGLSVGALPATYKKHYIMFGCKFPQVGFS